MSARSGAEMAVVFRRRSPAIRPFAVVTAVAGILLVYEVVRANVSAKHQQDWPWNLHLLGIPTTAAVLIAALLALLARDQYARSVAPILRYVSQWVVEPETLTTPANRYRQVIIRNAGPGTAIVVGAVWDVAGGEATYPRHVTSLTDLRSLLEELKLTDGIDYTITNYSPGTALAPGEERLYFEATDAAMAKFSVFGASFEFESLLGDGFEKAMSLLPRPGASDAISSPAEALRA
jgi:hypothetical protein